MALEKARDADRHCSLGLDPGSLTSGFIFSPACPVRALGRVLPPSPSDSLADCDRSSRLLNSSCLLKGCEQQGAGGHTPCCKPRRAGGGRFDMPGFSGSTEHPLWCSGGEVHPLCHLLPRLHSWQRVNSVAFLHAGQRLPISFPFPHPRRDARKQVAAAIHWLPTSLTELWQLACYSHPTTCFIKSQWALPWATCASQQGISPCPAGKEEGLLSRAVAAFALGSEQRHQCPSPLVWEEESQGVTPFLAGGTLLRAVAQLFRCYF